MKWFLRVTVMCVLMLGYAGLTGCKHDTYVEDGHGHHDDHHDEHHDDHHW